MKKYGWILIDLLCVTTVGAAIPTNYYVSVNGQKSPDAILSALHGIIDNHNEISYAGLEPYYAQTDLDSTGHLLDMYSKCEFTMDDANCSQKNVCDCWNKEHSVPQSWFNEAAPMKSDLFHVVPTDARVNNFRSNYPYGETSSTAYIDKDPSSLGHLGSSNFAGYTGTVYEPDDEYKGDFARIYFYMVARYLNKQFTKAANGAVMFTYSNSKADLTTYAINLLLKWHRNDPVSQKEIDRNNAVYGIQQNRNPFVDYPYLAEYVWGTQQNVQVDLAGDFIASDDPLFEPGVSEGSIASISPTIRCASSTVAFPTLVAGDNAFHQLTITGANLTGAISASITGTNAALFSVEPSYIAAASANGKHVITLAYNPTTVGKHTATLTLTSAGADDLVIALVGACAEESKITWKVDGQVYTKGSPTTILPAGGIITILPTAPASCSEESSQFVGWSQYLINDTTDDVPGDLFSDAIDAPEVVENVTFHAVFAQMYVDSGSAPVADSIDFPKKYSKDTEIKSEKIGTTKVNFVQDQASTQAKYYNKDGSVRVYAKSRMDFIGKNIMKIVLTYGSDDHSNEITASTGKFSNDTWTGKTDSVSLSVGGTKNHRKIAKIVITTQEKVEEYKYRRFMTSCSPITTVVNLNHNSDSDNDNCNWRKELREGRLIIEVDGVRYNMLGIREN